MKRSLFHVPYRLILVLLALSAVRVSAQPPNPPRTAKQASPIDLTGYWVAVVVEDWKYRMIHANKGDYSGLPVNAAARKVARHLGPSSKIQLPARTAGTTGL